VATQRSSLEFRKVSKKLGFFVLQDTHGQVQLIARASVKRDGVATVSDSGPLELLDRLPLQSVLQVSGIVRRRIPSAVTPVSSFSMCIRLSLSRRKGPAGAVEVAVDDIQLLNPANEKLPFSPNDDINLVSFTFRIRICLHSCSTAERGIPAPTSTPGFEKAGVVF
jgi:aspartyl-tRNA synthetase